MLRNFSYDQNINISTGRSFRKEEPPIDDHVRKLLNASCLLRSEAGKKWEAYQDTLKWYQRSGRSSSDIAYVDDYITIERYCRLDFSGSSETSTLAHEAYTLYLKSGVDKIEVFRFVAYDQNNRLGYLETYRPGQWEEHLINKCDELLAERDRKLAIENDLENNRFTPIDDSAIFSQESH